MVFHFFSWNYKEKTLKQKLNCKAIVANNSRGVAKRRLFCSFFICIRSPVTALQKLCKMCFIFIWPMFFTLNLRSGFSYSYSLHVICEYLLCFAVPCWCPCTRLTLSLSADISRTRSQLPPLHRCFYLKCSFVHSIKCGWCSFERMDCNAYIYKLMAFVTVTIEFSFRLCTPHSKFYATLIINVYVCMAFYSIERLYRCRALRLVIQCWQKLKIKSTHSFHSY